MFLCPVPSANCCGSLKEVAQNKSISKLHVNQAEVKRCIRRYMSLQGYKAMPNRELHKEGEPVLVLSKKSGSLLRKGKRAPGVNTTTRFNFKNMHLPIKAM